MSVQLKNRKINTNRISGYTIEDAWCIMLAKKDMLTKHTKRRMDTNDTTENAFEMYNKVGRNECTFEEKIKEKLMCPVCIKMARPPIKQCCRGHPICHTCWEKCPWCPLCRVRKTDTRALAIEQLATGVVVECDYKSEGCCEKILYENLQAHYDSCAYHTVACCPIDGCDEMIQMNVDGKLLEHIMTAHKVVVSDECGETAVKIRKGMKIGKVNGVRHNKMGWSLIGYKQKKFIVVSKQTNDMFTVTVTGLGKQKNFGKFYAEMTMRDMNNKVCVWKEEISTSEERYDSRMKNEFSTSYFNIYTKQILQQFAKHHPNNADLSGENMEISFDITISS